MESKASKEHKQKKRKEVRLLQKYLSAEWLVYQLATAGGNMLDEKNTSADA